MKDESSASLHVEHANATKARWVALGRFSPLLLFGNQEPIFKRRDGLKGCPGKLSGNGWRAAAWRGRELLMVQEMRNCTGQNSHGRSQGERRGISALKVKTK